MLEQIADGRTDLVIDWLAQGGSADAVDASGTSLVKICAYFGDVSALKVLVGHGARLADLGDNLDLTGAAFHGHWQLCRYLIEQGADARWADPLTGETALHAALCRTGNTAQLHVVRILIAAGADPNHATTPGIETGSFMRDSRTRGETPLHRAAAFAGAETIQALLDGGANREARDINGDSALGWASWYDRPTEILRLLCFEPYRVRAGRAGMSEYLVGKPHI